MSKRFLALAFVCALLLSIAPAWAARGNKDKTKANDTSTPSASETERIQKAAEVFKEINAVPEKSIPNELLERAECVVVIPSMMKGGFIFGGRYGKGVTTCREASGKWSPPSMTMIAGGSWGAQIGGQEVDLVMLAMNDKAKRSLMEGSKITLGAGLSASAGPVGRTAEAGTTADLQSEFLTYSRSRGLFAGITLQGATLRPDNDANRGLYGKNVTAQQVLAGQVPTPAVAQPLLSELSTYARRAPEARR